MEETKKKPIKEKIKEFGQKVKPCIVPALYYGIGFAIAYTYRGVVDHYAYSRGLQNLHNDGLIKFHDPETNEEIDVRRAAEIATKLKANK